MSQIIGKKLKKVIQNRHYTYEKVAKLVGLNSKQHISWLLNEQADESWRYADIEKFCAVLRIPIEHILGKESKQGLEKGFDCD